MVGEDGPDGKYFTHMNNIVILFWRAMEGIYEDDIKDSYDI